MKGRVAIDSGLCKSCLYCVEACPKGVLKAGASDAAPCIAKPEECTGCALCAQVCPDIAIEVWQERKKTQ